MSATQRVSRGFHRLAVFIVGLSCLLASAAKADFTSGNELCDACAADEQKEPVKAIFCTSYIVGVGDTFQALQVAGRLTYYCIPDKVTNGQAIDVVKLYLRDHPETRQYHAPALVMLALKEKFPCQSAPGRTNP